MAISPHTRSATRRTILSALCVLPLAAMPASGSTDVDRALLAEHPKLQHAIADLRPRLDNNHPCSDEEFDAACGAVHDVLCRIEALHASSLPGYAVKASAMDWLIEYSGEEGFGDQGVEVGLAGQLADCIKQLAVL